MTISFLSEYEELIIDMLSDGLAVESKELRAAVSMTDWYFSKTLKSLHTQGLVTKINGRKGYSRFSYKLKAKRNCFRELPKDKFNYLYRECFKRALRQGEHI